MSDRNLGSYRIVDLTPGRRIWLNTLDLGGPAHAMYGLLEADVTLARRLATEQQLSFTGFLIHCLARAVAENKDVQAYRMGNRRLVVFDDVDVGMMIEHQDGERRALMGHVIRGADARTVRAIHDEIRAVQSAEAPAGRGMPAWFRRLMLLPWPLSWLVEVVLRWAVRRDPRIMASASGTVFVTSVGMFGGGHAGWGITSIPTSLSIVVGGIAWKPAVIAGRIEPREILSLTVAFDHDVVDGAPATRFVRRLLELVESADGLAAASPAAAA
jgi:pyruvate/2-oxoglutarate dehydrogenase complex dihydrolipoamide acyltransferase (E2) component